MPFLRLIRFPNLIIIALTMVLMRYGIIQPIFNAYRLTLEFPFFCFLLLVISVVLIAAGGYLINDYFDVQADTVNRPDEVVIGKHIKPETAYNVYFVMNAIALAITFYLSYKIGILSLFVIFPVTIGLLWFYSTIYKRQLLIGNILVSLITAAVPMLVAFYDIPPVYKNNRQYLMTYNLDFNVIFAWIGAFAFFAFLVNMVRELVKDAEDFEGDALYGRNTLPIVFGMRVTKMAIAGLIAFILFGLGLLYYKYLRFIYVYDSADANTYITKFDLVSFSYFLVLIFLPLIVTAILVVIARERKQYTLAARILKLVMVAGIMFAIVVRFKFI